MEKYLRIEKKNLKRENGIGFSFQHIKLSIYFLYTHDNLALIQT